MASDLHFPEYTAESGTFALPALGFVGIAGGMAQIARSGAPLIVLLGLPLLVAGGVFLLWRAFRRSATSTGPDGITVRAPFVNRATSWPDIQAIEIEPNPALGANPAELAVLYDRTGRRTVLPHLNDRTVFDLAGEVERLQALWVRLRGDGWQLGPEAVAAMANARRGAGRVRRLNLAVAVFALVVIVALVVFLILLFSGVFD